MSGRSIDICSMASIFRGLRRAAPRLSPDFFICQQCINHSRPAVPKLAMPGKLQQAREYNVAANPFRTIRTPNYPSVLARQVSSKAKASPSSIPEGAIEKPSPLAPSRKSEFFPKTSSKSVAYWLLASAASVFGIVIFGGLTRLTESGYVNSRTSY